MRSHPAFREGRVLQTFGHRQDYYHQKKEQHRTNKETLDPVTSKKKPTGLRNGGEPARD